MPGQVPISRKVFAENHLTGRRQDVQGLSPVTDVRNWPVPASTRPCILEAPLRLRSPLQARHPASLSYVVQRCRIEVMKTHMSGHPELQLQGTRPHCSCVQALSQSPYCRREVARQNLKPPI